MLRSEHDIGMTTTSPKAKQIFHDILHGTDGALKDARRDFIVWSWPARR